MTEPTDTERIDFLERNLRQLWRRGHEVLLAARMPTHPTERPATKAPTVRLAIDRFMRMTENDTENP